jgi:hypothetical protein
MWTRYVYAYLHVFNPRKKTVVVELLKNLSMTVFDANYKTKLHENKIAVSFEKPFLLMNIANFGLFLRVDGLPPSALRVRHL